MKNRRKIEILKLAIKPAIMSPVVSLIVEDRNTKAGN